MLAGAIPSKDSIPKRICFPLFASLDPSPVIMKNSVGRGEEKKEEPTDVERKASYLKLAYESAMDVEKSRNCYDNNAELYETVHADGTWVGPRLLAQQVALRLQDSASQSTILDFGAGTGLLGRALAQNKIAATIEATDLSKDMLDVAQQTSEGVYTNFHIGLLNKDFTLENGNYDAVVSSGVIGTHVGFECVEEIMPCVKKGGSSSLLIQPTMELASPPQDGECADDEGYKLTFKSWGVLAAYVVLASNSAWIWITWSPITALMADHWNVPLGAINALSGVYFYVYLPGSFIATYLVVQKIGLAKGMWVASILNALGALVRWKGVHSYALVYVGTFLCAIAQSFMICSPPLISGKWFPDNERSTATSMGVLSSPLGSSLGLGSTILFTFQQTTAQGKTTLIQSHLDNYLCVQTVVAVIALVMTMVFLSKDDPPYPPNASAAERLLQLQEASNSGGGGEIELEQVESSFLLTQKEGSEPKDSSLNPSYMESMKFIWQKGCVFVLLYGISVGVRFSVPAFVSEFVPKWSPSSIGWLGLSYQLSATSGSLVGGRIADRYQNHADICTTALTGAVVFWGVFMVYHLRGIAHQEYRCYPLVFGALMGNGFCLASVNAVGMELAARITFPANEAAIGGVLECWAELVSFFLITIGGWTKAGPVFVCLIWCNILVSRIVLGITSRAHSVPTTTTATANPS